MGLFKRKKPVLPQASGEQPEQEEILEEKIKKDVTSGKIGSQARTSYNNALKSKRKIDWDELIAECDDPDMRQFYIREKDKDMGAVSSTRSTRKIKRRKISQQGLSQRVRPGHRPPLDGRTYHCPEDGSELEYFPHAQRDYDGAHMSYFYCWACNKFKTPKERLRKSS